MKQLFLSIDADDVIVKIVEKWYYKNHIFG